MFGIAIKTAAADATIATDPLTPRRNQRGPTPQTSTSTRQSNPRETPNNRPRLTPPAPRAVRRDSITRAVAGISGDPSRNSESRSRIARRRRVRRYPVRAPAIEPQNDEKMTSIRSRGGICGQKPRPKPTLAATRELVTRKTRSHEGAVGSVALMRFGTLRRSPTRS
jgi:hypothetical protein